MDFDDSISQRSGHSQVMSDPIPSREDRTLLVRGIGKIDAEGVRNFFALNDCGEIEDIDMHMDGSRPKGSCLVVFKSVIEARHALRLDGEEFDEV